MIITGVVEDGVLLRVAKGKVSGAGVKDVVDEVVDSRGGVFDGDAANGAVSNDVDAVRVAVGGGDNKEEEEEEAKGVSLV